MHNKTFIPYLHLTAILLVLMAMLTACEKPILDDAAAVSDASPSEATKKNTMR